MSRRDIIIISVLVNTGLLAVLFVTALKTDPESISAALNFDQPIEMTAHLNTTSLREVALNETPYASSQADEVDLVLQEYLPEVTERPQNESIEPQVVKHEEDLSHSQTNFVEIIVKSGDALEKIARANRTTVEAIRKVNGLQNDKLRIGQKLKVPIGQLKELESENVKNKNIPVSINAGDSPTYYTVKPGDNPWKIAKLHNVKFEELLSLNHLDEERAKNLKVGEKIRVR